VKTRKHHYIPKCYLKAWTGADAWLCDYQRLAGHIAIKRRHPSATGWLNELYTAGALPPEKADVLEAEFFQRVDQGASDVLQAFAVNRLDLTVKERMGWCRFLMSLLHRHPARIEQLWAMGEAELSKAPGIDEAEYLALKKPGDPPTATEYLERNAASLASVLFARVVQSVCESDLIGNHLMKMNWSLTNTPNRLMTSDRPLLVTGPLAHRDTVAMLPITPRRLFIATNSASGDDALNTLRQRGELEELVNIAVVRQAHRHAYGVCKDHVKLAEANLLRGLALPWEGGG
jgi:hypothetical protein